MADALSRMHGEENGELMAITFIQPKWLQEIQASYANDPKCQELIVALQADPRCKPH